MGSYQQGFPLTTGTFAANSELVTGPVWDWFSPSNAPGPSFMGGARPASTIPTGVGASLGVGGGSSSGGGSGAGLTRNGVLVLVLMAIVGLLGLRYVHWR